MNKQLIPMTSITYAMKAKKLLNAHGIYCEIERTPKNISTGCGYSLRVKDTAATLKFLEQYHIPTKL